ncbi:NADH:flavin oxidoreductase/NADH oxidase [Rubrobacter xylanophilus DSM 9941]|uniref:NADH:flavin oxidoreductase/NADH oxidase n=1 Tax=Rubrobacter xylanophilus (strain DSM 9941 / JCM 11954 / NBRC 16129 / PRD-1) TaxID=266117 RepID=Q1ATS4_RUBXD|nr:bifunctional salicylyl-CoA 5-hydroxylase/oxidoreductase [Rubrobacter xylanophilus]ABG05204.1 NADH:flavin oxidoreductase/NADH oxidase [Rubrobacter xylanophilus DSM 9941]
MKIVCIGGGPAGLYFGISLKLRQPEHEVTVIERNPCGVTFGWGVVFSDQTLGNLHANDPKSARRIQESFAHWDDIAVHVGGKEITRSGGHGFVGIARRRLLEILTERAVELGVEVQFEREVEDLSEFADADLIVASDGANSKVRERYAEKFGPSIDVRRNKYIWLGTRKLFDAFTFAFEKTEAGWVWIHAYRFDRDTSTCIVECSPETWKGLGFDRMEPEESIALCEEIFAPYLDGHGLINNMRHLGKAPWLNFRRISNERWFYDNIVLIGDAAHTAHFSIGSGTKLALEDAIALAEKLQEHGAGRQPYGWALKDALESYEAERRLEVLKLQSAARNSTEWFENVPRYINSLEPMQFAYSLLTRSQRVSHENLRLRDRNWLEKMERWFAGRYLGKPPKDPVPPMFTPFSLRNMELMNRVVVSPMAMYSAEDGTPNDFHLVHWGTRAQGGAGLVFTEMTCVTPQGRISPGCCGMYKPEHEAAFKRIVDFVHTHTHAKFALQLGHSGIKGSTRRGWEGADQPLEEGNWEVIGPSPVPWSEDNQIPREMTYEDMEEVKEAFVRATKMGERAGFDMLELHCAHGYLLSSFITPLLNRRTDEYGGSLENRLRYPLEVFRAMREVWPEEKPMSVRISATDWVDGGITADDAVEIARAFWEAGADLIDVSAGQTSPDARPVYGRMFQTPFSDRIRNELGIATMAVGNIWEADHVNSIIAAGRADLCALARPHLYDPYWTLRRAIELGYDGVPWPDQYLSGKAQLKRNVERASQMAQVI